MKISVSKNILQDALSTASHFVLSKISSIQALQNGLISFDREKISITTTNLNEFFYCSFKAGVTGKGKAIVDIKKIVEFLSFLPPGKIDLEITEKSLIIKSEKTKGSFGTISSDEFPNLPQTEGKKYKLKKELIEKVLPLIIFSAARDEGRPTLTGINFTTGNNIRHIVSTDGFRLSLYTEKDKEDFPNATISAGVLAEVIKLAGVDTEITVVFSEVDKTVKFEIKDMSIYSRIIEGDFPPFEKVIPGEYKTKITLNREEFLRNMKLAAVFARELSNTIVFDIKKDGLYINPKTSIDTDESTIYQEGQIEGEAQKIAFNHKFVIDFLNNIKDKEVVFEMTTSGAPGVFKGASNKNFIHIIMPIRMDEST